ncbi:KpsF/GutQ family sugar-phosphate isomerase, partial [Candidatus Fermentibacteria bacterium]
MADLYKEALRVFRIESEWLEATARLAEGTFERAVEVLARTDGKIVICGMGKSGHVGRKIAAT